jgi:ATP-dependent DNA helicase RecG
MMIWNHGELPDGLTIEKLKEKHLSQPRNKLLASVFYKAGYIETWGRGTLKIIEECKKHGLPEPKIEMFSGGFGITIFKEIYNEDYLEKLDLNDRQKKAIIYIKENESITNSIYREMFDIAHQTAIRDFDELIKLKMISKTGEGRGTKYVINVDGYKTL